MCHYQIQQRGRVRGFTDSFNSHGLQIRPALAVSRERLLPPPVIILSALGIGANAAIFSLVRGVPLRPLVNRDENRLIYIRQSAPGLGEDNSIFSALKTIQA